MRALIVAVLLASGLWSGYWFVGASQINSFYTELIDTQSSNVQYGTLDVTGFPNRFDTTLTDVVITQDEIKANLPFLQILALSYNPGHVIVIWPDMQTIDFPDQTLSLTSSSMQASAVFGNWPPHAFGRGTLVGENLSVSSSAGWNMDIAGLTASTRDTNDGAGYEAAVDLETVGFPFLEDDPEFEGVGPLQMRARYTATTLAPLTADTMSSALASVSSVSVSNAQISQGETAISVSGDFLVDENGFLSGNLSLKVEQWQALLAKLAATGAIASDAVQGISGMIGLFAANPQDPENLDLIITMRDGQMFMGPIPLGAAPRLPR